MAQQHAEKHPAKTVEQGGTTDPSGLSPESQAKVDAATEGMDALLDEIDELLGTEEQSAAMVAGFIQKGGQ